MQDESNRSVAEEEDAVDKAILALLLTPEEQRRWSQREVELEMGDPIAAVDSLARLRAAGLIHRCSEFASRAARRSRPSGAGRHRRYYDVRR
jgi:hypothetical protein